MLFKLGITLCAGLMLQRTSSSPHHMEDRGEGDGNHEASCHSNNQTAIVDAINNFGFSLTNQIGEQGNMFFSPFGLSMALGMAYLGAHGNTAQQMEHALTYEAAHIRDQQVHDGMKQLCETTRQRATDNGYSLDVANGLFHQNGSHINQEFVQGIENNYHGVALSLDFAGHNVESTATINNWVKEKTMDKIEELFAQPLAPDTKVVLTNAIYFKGNWKIEFPERRSYESRFYVKESNEWKNAQMMSLAEETFPYFKDVELDYHFLEMPYKGDKVSMLFALPLKYDDLPNLRMTEELLCRIRIRLVETELETISIPKFKITYEKKLKEPLVALGMEDAFNLNAADFSGISPQGLYISEVVHKAVIEVNEKGSEAAAVSGILLVPLMARQVTEFIANHAFLFYIIDKESGAILFSGRMTDP